MSDFRESQKVPYVNKNYGIIKHLDELEHIYNPDGKTLDHRTNVLRSGNYIFLNVMLLTGLLYSLNDNSRGIVDSTITGRIKSIESTALKNKRAGREKKLNRDIVACTIATDRVHNSKNFFNVFRSDKIQGLYNERKSNLDLMKLTIEFLKDLDMYSISSELDDVLSAEESRQRLQEMKNNSEKILNNINRYYEEDESNLLEGGFPVRECLQVMCEDLMQQEIDRAIESLDKEIERMAKEQGTLESTFEKDLNKANLDNLQMRKSMLAAKTDYTQKELVTILNGIIDEERFELYKSVLQYLKDKEIEERYDGHSGKGESSKEKIYCELLTLILYQLTKLEFVKKDQYEGLTYHSIWTNLHNQLKQYKHCEIDHGTYGNITFENLQKLLVNLTRLNARLSDQLQYEISKYQMRYTLKSIIQMYQGDEYIECEEKLKPNGYVAIHYDCKNLEMKTMTHFREGVATRGSASYASGRIDNRDEKKKEIKRLNFGKFIFKAAKKPYSIKQAELNNELKRRMSLDEVSERYMEYIKKRKNTEMIKEAKNKWREHVLGIIPRYFSARYDKENDVVEIEFLSELENVNRLYSETSIIQDREAIKRRTKTLGKLGFLSNEPFKITVSRNQYKDFIQRGGLVELRDKIAAELSLEGRDRENREEEGVIQE